MARKTGVTLTGDWRKLNALMRKLGTTPDMVNQLIRSEAQLIQQEIIDTIEDYNDIPNTESTLRRKGRTKTALTETGTLASTMGIIIEEQKTSEKKIFFTIKGNPNLTHRRSGMTYEAIAEINEFGAENVGRHGGYIPPRPVFTMTFDKMRRDVSRNLIMKVRSAYRGL